MPLSKFQKEIARALAISRTNESYVAGGAPIARESFRMSGDIDFFQDREVLVASAALADLEILRSRGLDIIWNRKADAFWSGDVIGGPER